MNNIKVILDSEGCIKGYSVIGDLKGSINIELDDLEEFKKNYKNYKFLDGVLLKDSTKILESEKEKARQQRNKDFQALDLYDKTVLRGDTEETPEMKIERDTFRKAWLSLPNSYTDINIDIETLYPEMPEFITYFV